jgi:indole-3-glycerol phosphate synthase
MDQPQVIYDPDVVDQLEITGFLADVMTHMRDVVAQRQAQVPTNGLRALNSIQRRPRDLISYLRQDRSMSLIIEIKRRTHLGQVLFEDRYEPDDIARYYQDLGVQAIAVATNERYYGGALHHLTYVSQEVKIPVIRQDFVFDRYQVYEARAAGADSVILIAALLGQYRLWDLVSLTQRLRMTAIVQVETEEELRRALNVDPRVICISNVNWRTLEVDLSKTTQLAKLIPSHVLTISMGGVRTAEDVTQLAEANADAIIAGEAILSAPDKLAAIEDLFSMIDTNPTDPWKPVE